eukprot:9281103-Lingulodinium_polyedra.AAC.1
MHQGDKTSNNAHWAHACPSQDCACWGVRGAGNAKVNWDEGRPPTARLNGAQPRLHPELNRHLRSA